MLERLEKKIRKIEEILGEKFEVNTDKVFSSTPNDPNTENSPMYMNKVKSCSQAQMRSYLEK